MNNLSEKDLKITQIFLDVVERDLDFVGLNIGNNNAKHPGVTGGTVQQGIIRLITNNGIEGNSIIGQHRGDSTNKIKEIINTFKPLLINSNPLERESLWNSLFSGSGTKNIGNYLNSECLASIDVALWDIVGKLNGLPVHKIIGQTRRSIPVYGTYQPRHEDFRGYLEEASELKSKNFKAYKIHPGFMSTKDTIRTIEEIRKLLGPDFTLMLDPNNGYDFQKALEIGEALDANNYHWFEDPVPWNDFESINKLSSKLKTPLAMSDQSGFLFEEFSNYLNNGYPQLLRGTSRKFGITGLKQLCSLAENFKKHCEIGTGGNIFMNMANIHVMMTITNCDFYEYWMPTWAHDFACSEEIELDNNSEIIAPSKSGIGLTLDEDWIKSHKISTLK